MHHLPAILRAALAVSSTFLPCLQETSPGGAVTPDAWRVVGLELPCPDPARAAAFYEGALGWEPVRTVERGALMRMGETLLVLDATRPASEGPSASILHLNHRVADLETAAAAVEEHGGTLVDVEPQPFALGRSIEFRDPEGNVGMLVRLDVEPEPGARLPGLFNLSVRAPDVAQLERFFRGELGFEVHSRAYLPETLPLEQRGTIALVLHGGRDEGKGAHGSGAALLVAADDPSALLAHRPDVTRRSSPLHAPGFVLRGPAGIEVVALAGPALEAAQLEGLPRPDGSGARAILERFKGLAGRWVGHSTEGWVNDASIQVIARGSAVCQESLFGAHPGETMLTLFHLDGERLLLTHYCVAGNQPRLVADGMSADGSTVVFDFLDATNLASVDAGHMHRVVYRFEGPDRFVSRWSWYQGGVEGWMEEIAYERVEDGKR